MTESVPPFECELVLREADSERRLPHTFLAELRPGTHVHLDGIDWIVMEVEERPGSIPHVVCARVSEAQ
jgi:hypothetical protein